MFALSRLAQGVGVLPGCLHYLGGRSSGAGPLEGGRSILCRIYLFFILAGATNLGVRCNI